MSNWQTEIEELHAFFEAYFLGNEQSLDRVEAALATDFTIVSPTGSESSRSETIAALQAGHGQATELGIRVTDCKLLHDEVSLVVASYVEHHDAGAGPTTQRRSTVVFSRDITGPNGLRWQRVHETWIPSTA